MKYKNKGFIGVGLMVAIIAVLAAGGAGYGYVKFQEKQNLKMKATTPIDLPEQSNAILPEQNPHVSGELPSADVEVKNNIKAEVKIQPKVEPDPIILDTTASLDIDLKIKAQEILLGGGVVNHDPEKDFDAYITAIISGARAAAEIYYSINNKSYAGFCVSVQEDNKDVLFICKDTTMSYSISAKLKGGELICADATGQMKTLQVAPTGTSC